MLNRQQPSEPSGDGIGSQDYSKEPAAILLGLADLAVNKHYACPYKELVEDDEDAPVIVEME